MKKIALAALAAFSFQTNAAELSFTTFEASYEQAEFDCSSNCDGFALSGNLAFSNVFYGTAEFSSIDDLGDDISVLGVGIGARHYLSDTSAIYGEFGAVRIDVDTRFGDGNRTEGFVGAGVRGMVAEQVELDFNLNKILQSGIDVSAEFKSTYFFNEQVGGFLAINAGDGFTGAGLGVRINF
jgi:hypothetical protein